MEYYLSTIPIDTGTKFKFTNHTFYIYTNVRRKNMLHLYTPSLRSLARIIFLQYLQYSMKFPDLTDCMFPTVKYEYSTEEKSFCMYYDTHRLYYLKKENEPTYKSFNMEITRTLTFTEIGKLLDYQSLETYLETHHEVTNIDVIGSIFVDELQHWAKLIHECGFENTFDQYFYPSPNDIINYLLIKNYIRVNCTPQ